MAKAVIGAAIEVHRTLGPGLMESAYSRCFAHELTCRRIPFVQEAPVPVAYKNLRLDCGYRIDFLVDARLVVELKAVDRVLPIHHAQLLTYLKLLDANQGLLINFNVTKLMNGLKSFVS